MNANSTEAGRKTGGVDDKVSDLTIESVGGIPSKGAAGLIRIRVDHAKSKLGEGAGSLDHGTVDRITDELGVEEIDDGVGYQVGSRKLSV